MRKIIILICLIPVLTGCSLIPKINFDKGNQVPQQTEKSKRKIRCKGDIILNENGTVDSCTKGYYEYSENYAMKERKYTLKEKIINFFSNLIGWSFWIIVALVIFAPGVIGLVIGRIIEGVFGIAKKGLTATVRGIQNARKNGKNLDDALASEQDEGIKKYIRKLKEQEKIK